jgi:uncharacterized protein (TIGR02646 family)
MIRIDRPKAAPAALTDGAALVVAKSALHDANPALYATAKGRFTFDEKVYGAQSVRLSLKEAQHYKCCFCESKVEHIAPGEVEHFRPKAAWKQGTGQKLTRPGYYWLAYSWDNLLWSCKFCNGKHKGNHFPLQDPTLRNCAGRMIAGEEPMLVDPSAVDPREHIRFKLEVARPLTPIGEKTISVLDLNRELLLERRRERLDHLVQCRRVVEYARQQGRGGDAADAERTLAHSVLPRAPYSSMALDLLADLASTRPAPGLAPVP